MIGASFFGGNFLFLVGNVVVDEVDSLVDADASIDAKVIIFFRAPSLPCGFLVEFGTAFVRKIRFYLH